MIILKRHVTYFVVYSIIVLGISEYVFPELFSTKENLTFLRLYKTVGIVIFYIRLCEPYILSKIKNLWGSKLRKRENFTKESLDSFLYSALNIEFVYIILLGINNYMDLATEKFYDMEN